MHCDVIVWGRNDVYTDEYKIRQSIRHFTDFSFVKRMQMFYTTQSILEKGVYISRKEKCTLAQVS